MTLALIDGDLLSFRSAVVTENENEGLANWRTEQTLLDILNHVEATEFLIFIGGGDNFRKQVDPQYKAHRTKPKPKYLPTIEQFLMEQYGAIRVHGIETDDALGILQQEDSVICSLDKDLLQVPGLHYQWSKNNWVEVDNTSGIRHFYKQLLIGDRADNITGVQGIGTIKAGKLLDPVDDPEEMFSIVEQLYPDKLHFERNCHLLWILKSHNLFSHPSLKRLKPEPEVKLESIQETETGNVLSTVHGIQHLTIDGISHLGLTTGTTLIHDI